MRYYERSRFKGKLMDFWKKGIGGAVRVLKDRASRIDVGNSPRAEPATLADAVGQPLFVPPGHYYSPIVNTAQLASGKYLDGVAADPLLGVDLKEATILATFDRLARHFVAIDFPETKADTHRYYFQNDFYTYGDAMFLSAMICEFKPPRIVEVGSGYSSAVILDTLDSLGAGDTKCTFIEPFPERLRMLLRPQDGQRVRILETGIQDVPLSTFETLEAGSFLFFDTTHISKTGSDVNHEVFQILPRLRPGVIVHFHDVFDQFEYPKRWIIDENRSWNELYLLRAFLMYNSKFETILFNNLIANRYPDKLRALSEKAARNAGGGLWLRVLVTSTLQPECRDFPARSEMRCRLRCNRLAPIAGAILSQTVRPHGLDGTERCGGRGRTRRHDRLGD